MLVHEKCPLLFRTVKDMDVGVDLREAPVYFNAHMLRAAKASPLCPAFYMLLRAVLPQWTLSYYSTSVTSIRHAVLFVFPVDHTEDGGGGW